MTIHEHTTNSSCYAFHIKLYHDNSLYCSVFVSYNIADTMKSDTPAAEDDAIHVCDNFIALKLNNCVSFLVVKRRHDDRPVICVSSVLSNGDY